jgi:hypothetical protein
MVRSAFYTDPEDQCAWIYYRWWLDYLEKESILGITSNDYIQLLRREVQHLRELLELEPDGKCKSMNT